ncbi:MAG: iron-sulfur cluster assembly protein [Candidatus Micrarchaeota archaeon]
MPKAQKKSNVSKKSKMQKKPKAQKAPKAPREPKARGPDPKDVLRKVFDPETGLNLIDAGFVKDVKTDGTILLVKITPPYPEYTLMSQLIMDIRRRAFESGYRSCEVRVLQ